MIHPGGDGEDPVQWLILRVLDLNRAGLAGGGAVAQLAVAVVPPCPDRAVALQRDGVPNTTVDGRAGKIRRSGLIAGGCRQRTGVALAGASAQPATEGGVTVRYSGQRDRRAGGVAAAAICAAVDGRSGNPPEPTAGLGDIEVGIPRFDCQVLRDLRSGAVSGVARLVRSDGAGAGCNTGYRATADRANALRGGTEADRLAGTGRGAGGGRAADRECGGREADRADGLTRQADGDALRDLRGGAVSGVARLVRSNGASARCNARHRATANGANPGRLTGERHRQPRCGCRAGGGCAACGQGRWIKADRPNRLAGWADGEVLRNLGCGGVVSVARLMGRNGASADRITGHRAATDRADAGGGGAKRDRIARRAAGGADRGRATHAQGCRIETDRADALAGLTHAERLSDLRRGEVVAVTRLIRRDGASTHRNARHRAAADRANPGRLTGECHRQPRGGGGAHGAVAPENHGRGRAKGNSLADYEQIQ